MNISNVCCLYQYFKQNNQKQKNFEIFNCTILQLLLFIELVTDVHTHIHTDKQMEGQQSLGNMVQFYNFLYIHIFIFIF